MSQAHVVSHLVRRGVAAAHEHFQGVNPEYMDKLQQDAELYEQAGPHMQVNPLDFLPVVLTGLVMVLLIASVSRVLLELRRGLRRQIREPQLCT